MVPRVFCIIIKLVGYLWYCKIFNIAKESCEIVPETIINHNVVLEGLRAFSTKEKKMMKTFNILL